MAKWECLACGYVYDPETGDPDAGIEPGTPFEEIPDNWICPECGEEVPGEFDLCWSCNTPYPDDSEDAD